MDKKYLPSKFFVIRIAFILVLAVTIFGVYEIVTYFKNRPSGKAPVKVMVKDIVQKDSNSNGIPDWEEYLWGLNPLKDGPSNKEFILAKRKTLAENNGITEDGSNLTSTDQLSREFFSIVMSLQQSGSLNEDSIKLVSEAIGKKIESTPIPDVYTKEMLTVKTDSISARTNYFNQFKNLSAKYEGRNIGDELVFISQGLKNNDKTAMKATKSVSDAYKEFGQELMKIPVPTSIASIHLDLANSYEKTGQSIEGLTQILDDSMVGMKAIINYKKYSDAIVSDIEYIGDNL